MKSILVTGGARSGKSTYAQNFAMESGKEVLFVATATAGDEEMKQRIENHKRARPSSWETLEVATHVGNSILEKVGKAELVIVDCITLLVNNVIGQYADDSGEQFDTSLVERDVVSEINELIDCMKRLDISFIVVTNEVGTGLVPVNKMGRVYRDLLGRANQLLAKQADEVYLMVTGLPLMIKPNRLLDE
ncbi:bifunctional adenosylcobinamide kinase/adenosylcobinamide-phosphate guanylyltransferase [Chloroflexota bacterium]